MPKQFRDVCLRGIWGTVFAMALPARGSVFELRESLSVSDNRERVSARPGFALLLILRAARGGE
jgi:hypothetical protein